MQEEAPSRGTEHNQRNSADIFSVLRRFCLVILYPRIPGLFLHIIFVFLESWVYIKSSG